MFFGAELKAMMRQHVWPDRIFGVRGLRDDPEALMGVVDDGHYFVSDWGNGPVFAQEVQGIIGIESALEGESQVEVQKGDTGNWAQEVAFFSERQIPGVIWSQAGRAADMVLVLPINLDLEQSIGIRVIGDFFEGQESDEAVLESAKAAFDFAFCGSIWSDAMSDPQGGKSALELGVGIESIGRGGMAEKS